jgi:uncharacterized phage-associated protein
MPSVANHAANSILNRAFKENVDLSLMKLQRLLFFVAAEYIKETKQPLLHEAFRPWAYGPVAITVHDKFQSHRGRPIRVFAKDAAGIASMVSESANPAFAAALDRVWAHGKHLSAVELSRTTHIDGSAWYQAYTAGEPSLSDESMLWDTTYQQTLHIDAAVLAS